jgi:RNA polymerase sigma-70 factor (ECF subfamily)
MVLAAQDSAAPEARLALERLCQTYWYPLYAFVRREGYSSHDAQDLTQEFFARLLEKQYLAQVNPGKGKFRSFLLAALRHFLSDQRDRAQARKRGGQAVFISLDQDQAEERYQQEPREESTPEKIFERRWALAVLEQAQARLREEYQRTGKSEWHAQLKDYLTEELAAAACERLARHLQLSESAVRSALHRLRQRYAEVVREEIAHTVASPAEVDDELRYLIGIISAE